MITAMAVDWYVPFEDKRRYYFVVLLLGSDAHMRPVFDFLTFATRKEAQLRAQELYEQWQS